jgi:hypothetical protein
VKTRLVLFLVLGSFACACLAEPRWCLVVGEDASNKLVYPPIGKAARVWGLVTARMVYEPNGKVVRVEPIWGPAMLSHAVSDQLMNWTVKTEATGDELCETLVIAKFRLHGPGQSLPAEAAQSAAPSILRMTVDGEYVVISDPMNVVSTRNPFRILKYELKGAVKAMFRSNNSK